ncbi:MAG: hypothetical protein LBH94_00755 [Deltaproteobacteria bacterium]|jgi:hypothetical protein|nr:hypothetical protein [Deltaproteobacteria bacterium]
MPAQSVYLLQHSYDYNIGDGETTEETKIIGIFSTVAEAEAAILHYKNLPGFKDYPDDCFYLEEYELDRRFWEEGFVPAFSDDE